MKRSAPAAARNRDPIAAVLAEELPAAGLVLEIASGTGEHAVHFARAFPALEWLPSDPDPDALASIAAWRAEAGLPNVRPPVRLDAAAAKWDVTNADAVLCINMVHISPVSATEGLLRGAARLLSEGAPLIVYGPYIERGIETALSNVEFDRSLRIRNQGWGLREAEWLDDMASAQGLLRARRTKMPANNLMLIYRKA